LIPASPNQNQT